MTLVEGEDRLFVNIDTCVADVAAAAKKGLKTAGMRIIADAQRNMHTAGHNSGTLNNTGRLSQSGRVQDDKNSGSEVEIGFFSQTGERGYAAAVEYGSRPHWPPRQDIESWVHKKMRVAKDYVRSVAFLVSRHIATKGTKPHAFFAPAVEHNKQDITNAVRDAVITVLRKRIR